MEVFVKLAKNADSYKYIYTGYSNKSSVKNENISNKELAEELLKPIIRK